MSTIPKSVTTTTIPPARTSAVKTVLILAAAAVIAVGANTIVAIAAVAAGASSSFAPLTLVSYAPFTILGLAAASVGWRIVRARSARPRAMLRMLIPALTVLSFIPDAILLMTGFIPGSSAIAVAALATMHVIVVVVAVLANQRVAPV